MMMMSYDDQASSWHWLMTETLVCSMQQKSHFWNQQHLAARVGSDKQALVGSGLKMSAFRMHLVER